MTHSFPIWHIPVSLPKLFCVQVIYPWLHDKRCTKENPSFWAQQKRAVYYALFFEALETSIYVFLLSLQVRHRFIAGLICPLGKLLLNTHTHKKKLKNFIIIQDRSGVLLDGKAEYNTRSLSMDRIYGLPHQFF